MYAWLPLYRAIGTRAWATSSDILLITVPLFVLLGEILLRSGIATRMYAAMANWLSWLPGGLMHANIGASHDLRRYGGLERRHLRDSLDRRGSHDRQVPLR